MLQLCSLETGKNLSQYYNEARSLIRAEFQQKGVAETCYTIMQNSVRITYFWLEHKGVFGDLVHQKDSFKMRFESQELVKSSLRWGSKTPVKICKGNLMILCNRAERCYSFHLYMLGHEVKQD